MSNTKLIPARIIHTCPECPHHIYEHGQGKCLYKWVDGKEDYNVSSEIPDDCPLGDLV